MNEGLFGIAYGAVLKAFRQRVKSGQGASQQYSECVVLGTTDTTSPMSRSTGAGAPAADVCDLVLQVPYAIGRYGQAVTASGALSLQIPDGQITGGNRRGNGAVDLQTSRAAANYVASGAGAFIAGGANNTASGTYSVALGASSTASNTASVALGSSPSATGLGAIALGQSANASGTRTFAAGWSVSAAGSGSTALGQHSTDRGINNTFVFSGAQRAAVGDRQFLKRPQVAVTTNATTTTLTTDGGAEATTNTWVLPNNYTGIYNGWIVARNTANNDSNGWRFEGMVSRDASAATVALLGAATITAVGTADASMASVTLAVAVNTTNGSLIVQATGLAATTIAWAGFIDCIENG